MLVYKVLFSYNNGIIVIVQDQVIKGKVVEFCLLICIFGFFSMFSLLLLICVYKSSLKVKVKFLEVDIKGFFCFWVYLEKVSFFDICGVFVGEEVCVDQIFFIVNMESYVCNKFIFYGDVVFLFIFFIIGVSQDNVLVIGQFMLNCLC